MRKARFEVVHTGPRQFHARFRAANGEVVWTTESYKRRRAALRAIELLNGPPFWPAHDVREVDERDQCDHEWGFHEWGKPEEHTCLACNARVPLAPADER